MAKEKTCIELEEEKRNVNDVRFIRNLEMVSFVFRRNSIYSCLFSFVFYSQVFFISRESLFSVLFGISYPLNLRFSIINIKIK